MLGLGNSISAGWSAINNDVKPLVNKLEDFIMPYSIKYDAPIKQPITVIKTFMNY